MTDNLSGVECVFCGGVVANTKVNRHRLKYFGRLHCSRDCANATQRAKRWAGSLRRCSACREHKEPGQFFANASRGDGLSTDCKPCNNARGRRYAGANRLKVNERARLRFQAAGERYLQVRRKGKKTRIDRLSDSYVFGLLLLPPGTPKGAVLPLIELKRAQIRLLREVRKSA